jgi:hypothetical protein
LKIQTLKIMYFKTIIIALLALLILLDARTSLDKSISLVVPTNHHLAPILIHASQVPYQPVSIGLLTNYIHVPIFRNINKNKKN